MGNQHNRLGVLNGYVNIVSNVTTSPIIRAKLVITRITNPDIEMRQVYQSYRLLKEWLNPVNVSGKHHMMTMPPRAKSFVFQ